MELVIPNERTFHKVHRYVQETRMFPATLKRNMWQCSWNDSV